MPKKFHPRDKFCELKGCGIKYHDSSSNNQRKFCSDECKKIRNDRKKRIWYKTHYIKVSRGGKLIKFPNWKCPDCRYQVKLEFDPLNWRNLNKLRNMICKGCNSPAKT